VHLEQDIRHVCTYIDVHHVSANCPRRSLHQCKAPSHRKSSSRHDPDRLGDHPAVHNVPMIIQHSDTRAVPSREPPRRSLNKSTKPSIRKEIHQFMPHDSGLPRLWDSRLSSDVLVRSNCCSAAYLGPITSGNGPFMPDGGPGTLHQLSTSHG
jgi:hypothetical protein